MAQGKPLSGKVALVTGAAQGMGRVIATRLAAEGALVAVNDIVDDGRLTDLATETGGVPAPADVSDREQVRAMVQRLEQSVGPVDLLVANHAYMTMGTLADYDLDDWWKVVDTNLGGTFWLVQSVVPGMRRKGAGRIVVTCSEWGVIGWPEATAYSASKAGLVSLVKTLGRELAPDGVIVNGVAPGVIDTPQLQVDADAAGVPLEQMHALYAADIPLGRIGRPDEVAATVSLLADFRMQALVGQVLQVNGGSTRSRV